MKSRPIKRKKIVSVSVLLVIGMPAYPVHIYRNTPGGIERHDYNINSHRLDQLLEAVRHAKKKDKRKKANAKLLLRL